MQDLCFVSQMFMTLKNTSGSENTIWLHLVVSDNTVFSCSIHSLYTYILKRNSVELAHHISCELVSEIKSTKLLFLSNLCLKMTCLQLLKNGTVFFHEWVLWDSDHSAVVIRIIILNGVVWEHYHYEEGYFPIPACPEVFYPLIIPQQLLWQLLYFINTWPIMLLFFYL